MGILVHEVLGEERKPWRRPPRSALIAVLAVVVAAAWVDGEGRKVTHVVDAWPCASERGDAGSSVGRSRLECG